MGAKAIISSVAATAQLFASHALASCVITPESSHAIVRGRFVRCEDVSFYLEASGAYQRYERDLEAVLARVGPQNRERLFQRMGITDEFPYDWIEGRVVAISVEWHALIVPWLHDASQSIEFKEPPREMRETIRYWWRGPIEACESLTAWSSIDLWVYPECCDMADFAAPVCIISMSYAEPASDAMSDAITQMVGAP